MEVNKHTACGYSLFSKCSFDSNRNKHDYYRGKDCMKNCCIGLNEHVMKITDFERLKMLPLIEEENRFHMRQRLCYI